jgi:WD40 repeat protein
MHQGATWRLPRGRAAGCIFREPVTGTALGQVQAHRGEITQLAFAGDGKRLLTTGNNGTVLVWDTAEALAQARPLPAQVVPRKDNRGQPLPEYAVARLEAAPPNGNDTPNNILRLPYAPDSQTLAGGGSDGKVRLWQAATGKELRVLLGHRDEITSVAFTADGKTIVSTSADGTVLLWSVATGKELRRFAGTKSTGPATTLSRDGKTLCVANQDGVIQVWDVEQGKERNRFRCQENENGLLVAAFSPDGRVLAANGYLWKVAIGKKWFRIGFDRDLPDDRSPLVALAFSHDSRLLAAAESWVALDGKHKAPNRLVVRILEVATGLEVCKVERMPSGTPAKEWALLEMPALSPEGIRIPLVSLSLSPDGRVLVHTANNHSEGDAIVVTDLTSIQDLTLFVGDKGEGVAFPSGQGFRCLLGKNNRVTCVVFAPDGKTVTTGISDGTTLVWDLAAFLPPKLKAEVL